MQLRQRVTGSMNRGIKIKGGKVMSITVIVLTVAMLMYVGADWTMEEVVK